MVDLLENLNENQKRAVLHKDGPLLVLAGAGAGKTRAIAHRVAYLVSDGVEPSRILAITFTNKAANEMKERINSLLRTQDTRYKIQTPFISTFHSLGVNVLRKSGRPIGVPRDFSILDKEDSLSIVKSSIQELGMDPKQFQPAKMQSIISRYKGDLVTSGEFEVMAGSDYFPSALSKIWSRYEEHLKKQKALDFDDLVAKTFFLLKKDAKTRDYYQNLWQYILIDEYQDTNKSQYELSKILAAKHKNICVIGDIDQCLLSDTKILTRNGSKNISKIKKGEKVTVASGNGKVCESEVLRSKKRFYEGEIIKIKTKSGKELKLTPNHIVFVGFSMNPEIYYVYLMYRKDRGFRVGMVQGARKPRKEDYQMGFLVRSNQEKADRMWILKVCKNKPEAQYWEYFFSFHYGLPSVVFFSNGRKMTFKQDKIDKLYKSIDTNKRAGNLFNDLNFNFEYPHYFPQGTARSNHSKKRINLRLTLFGDKRGTLTSPWGLHRISINSADLELRDRLKKHNFGIRKGKKRDWRLEIARVDYAEIEKIANQLIAVEKDLIITRSAFLTKEKKFLFQPAANLHPSMKIASINGKKEIIEDEIRSVKKEIYKGSVYDLDIDKVHNYIANGITVHNSIYSWRGADFRNIINFESDYPEHTSVILEENYRSTQTILEAAAKIIEKNKMRKPKRLISKKEKGAEISLFEAMDEGEEAEFVAHKIKELRTEEKNSEIAVLYRANYQSRILEEFCLKHGIPYQILGTQFYHRKEVKDIFAFLRAALNLQSLVDIKRIINVPPRGIGKTTILNYFAGKELSGEFQKKINAFLSLLELIKEKISASKPSDAIRFVMRESGYEKHLKDGGDDDKERLENLRELVSIASRYDHLEGAEGIEKLLTDAVLMSEQDTLDKSQEAVRLMTVHSAKGLEFKNVFIVGLEDGLFPHNGFGDNGPEKEEEERRLFYVAITRAKERLFLSFSLCRTIFGSKQMNLPSRFLSDIPKHLMKIEDYDKKEEIIEIE